MTKKKGSKMSIEDDEMSRVVKKIALIVVAVALGTVFLFGSTNCVDAGHRGVKVRLGSVNQEVLPEGICLKWPIIETVYEISIQQQTNTETLHVYSSDLQPVDIAITTLWRRPSDKVVNLFQNYRESGDQTHYTMLISPKLSETVKTIAAKMSAEQLVKNREAIKTQIIEGSKTKINDLLTIDDISIVNIDLSDTLEKAIEQKMVMEQESLKKQFELERAKKDAEINIVNTEAQAKMKILAAEAEAKAIQTVGDALAKTPKMIDLELIKKWNGVSPTVVAGNTNSIILPTSQQK